MAPRQLETNSSSPPDLTEPLLAPSREQRQLGATDRALSASSETASNNNADDNNHRPSVSRNVHLTLLYTGFAFAGRSIWNSSVLAAFVFLLKGNLEAVGYITAVGGIAQLACSFPSAFVADSYRRDFLLKIASILGMVAIGATLFALHTLQFGHLLVALVAWGCCWGVANTSLSALFADSIPTGQRSHYFTQRATLITSGFTAGPIVSLIMFAILGDTWTVRDCAIVMGVGQIICFPAILILCFFNDDYAVDHGNDNDHEEGEVVTAAVGSNGGRHIRRHEQTPIVARTESNTSVLLLNREHSSEDVGIRHKTTTTTETTTTSTIHSGSDDGEDHMAVDDVDDDDDEPASAATRCSCLTEQRRIALLIATADLIGGLASGMSIRYFPIFFVDNLHLGPVKVQSLYILAPLLQTFTMKLAQKLSTRYGRCHISAMFKWVGCSLMYAIIVLYSLGFPNWLICVLYVFRTAFANSTGPLTKSVLMDNVPKKERAKWAALESLNMFSWSGSAALGGVLAGVIGMLPLFATTATMQLCSTLPIVALWAQDVDEAAPLSEAAAVDGENIASSSSSASLSEECNQNDEEQGNQGQPLP